MRMPAGPTVVVLSFTATTLAAVSMAGASEKIAEAEGLECQLCHANTEETPEILTDRGVYYQFLHTLSGYEEVLERFESCTYCHVDRAGNQALTAQGHRFRWMMEDMVGLKAWLDQHHPQTDEPREEE